MVGASVDGIIDFDGWSLGTSVGGSEGEREGLFDGGDDGEEDSVGSMEDGWDEVVGVVDG